MGLGGPGTHDLERHSENDPFKPQLVAASLGAGWSDSRERVAPMDPGLVSRMRSELTPHTGPGQTVRAGVMEPSTVRAVSVK